MQIELDHVLDGIHLPGAQRQSVFLSERARRRARLTCVPGRGMQRPPVSPLNRAPAAPPAGHPRSTTVSPTSRPFGPPLGQRCVSHAPCARRSMALALSAASLSFLCTGAGCDCEPHQRSEVHARNGCVFLATYVYIYICAACAHDICSAQDSGLSGVRPRGLHPLNEPHHALTP